MDLYREAISAAITEELQRQTRTMRISASVAAFVVMAVALGTALRRAGYGSVSGRTGVIVLVVAFAVVVLGSSIAFLCYWWSVRILEIHLDTAPNRGHVKTQLGPNLPAEITVGEQQHRAFTWTIAKQWAYPAHKGVDAVVLGPTQDSPTFVLVLIDPTGDRDPAVVTARGSRR